MTPTPAQSAGNQNTLAEAEPHARRSEAQPRYEIVIMIRTANQPEPSELRDGKAGGRPPRDLTGGVVETILAEHRADGHPEAVGFWLHPGMVESGERDASQTIDEIIYGKKK